MDALDLIPYLDLTTLGSTDSAADVEALARRAVCPLDARPDLHCGALCVWPNFAGAAKPILRDTPVKLASVAGAFPYSQAPLAVKVDEVRRAVGEGADEIDIAINRGLALTGGDLCLAEEIRAMKDACGSAHLKVILETCELRDEALIRRCCRIALEAGADFLKTSTGKGSHGATPEHARILLEEARAWTDRTAKPIGVKAAGGIRTYDEARSYIELARAHLPAVSPATLRLGASSLLDDLLQAA